eukprot:CAMPEP_0197520046 /NCGR_PEP_ID=MMETSP1318-20131121/5348_1 /TAXON_ID=552666 /ORGANISM="Partenskyella glossopodia, Strain RCC365" /LENGTH=174 /DNA_ID=CAMNT_0043071387 /DNA_START=14 /DNA_END=538 /DNA_ORIENTATION=-
MDTEGKQLNQPKRPNILVTGTPGTGKTSTCELLSKLSGWRHINLSDAIKQKSLHSGRDEEWDCYVLDENKVCDELEEVMVEGGNIVDFHTCDFFPERWFHLIVVLRSSNDVLFPRLQNRGYKLKKIQENVEAEIMQVVLDEAKESYKKEIVVELQSDSVEQLEANAEKVNNTPT